MPLDRVSGQPTWLLSRANARAQAILHAAFAAAGVRGYHYRLMAALAQHGPLSQVGLARSTGIDPKDVVHALNEVEARGLVAREPDPADRRRNVVTLTDAGDVELARLDAVLARAQQETIAPLTDGERVALLRLLEKLAGG